MIPLKYNIGNLNARRVSTLMTILGIGVVIAVMISMMALKNGVHSAIVSSIRPSATVLNSARRPTTWLASLMRRERPSTPRCGVTPISSDKRASALPIHR